MTSINKITENSLRKISNLNCDPKYWSNFMKMDN